MGIDHNYLFHFIFIITVDINNTVASVIEKEGVQAQKLLMMNFQINVKSSVLLYWITLERELLAPVSVASFLTISAWTSNLLMVQISAGIFPHNYRKRTDLGWDSCNVYWMASCAFRDRKPYFEYEVSFLSYVNHAKENEVINVILSKVEPRLQKDCTRTHTC